LPAVEEPIRAAEVVGALSLATDLGTGQPLEHALRTAVLAVRLGGVTLSWFSRPASMWRNPHHDAKMQR